MKKISTLAAALVLSLTGLVAATSTSNGAAFYGWSVTGVADWDTLNVRAWPSSQSQILVAYPNGTPISMTGVCTNGLDLGAISGMPAWKQRQQVRYRWCQAWIDPSGNGEYRTAWVYGRYIRPM